MNRKFRNKPQQPHFVTPDAERPSSTAGQISTCPPESAKHSVLSIFAVPDLAEASIQPQHPLCKDVQDLSPSGSLRLGLTLNLGTDQ